MLELKIRWISKLWWCCNMVSGTVTQIDREGERERKWRGGMGLRGLAPTWAQNVEGGVRVRGRAEGVKSTGVIHTLLHLAVILAGGNYNVRFIRTHYSATTCSLDHTCCHSLTWSNRSISWDMFCPHASWITTFPLPRTRWLATKCHQLSRVCVCAKWLFFCLECTGLFHSVALESKDQSRAYWQEKKKSQLFSAAKWEEKRFFFFSSFFTLSDSISRSIGISGVTRHEISPILGFRRNSILKPPEICGHITFSTSGQITLLCDSCKGKNCGDGKVPTSVKCFLTEAIKWITSDSTWGTNSFWNSEINKGKMAQPLIYTGIFSGKNSHVFKGIYLKGFK